MSNERALMQEVWRTAVDQPNGFRIPSQNPQSAQRLRFALYNAVKMYRNGKQIPDETLKRAIESCSVRIEGNDVVVQGKMDSDLSKQLLATLGRPPKSVEEHQMEESFARITASVALPTPSPAAAESPPVATNYGARVRKV